MGPERHWGHASTESTPRDGYWFAAAPSFLPLSPPPAACWSKLLVGVIMTA
jgi:hypothetical protein